MPLDLAHLRGPMKKRRLSRPIVIAASAVVAIVGLTGILWHLGSKENPARPGEPLAGSTSAPACDEGVPDNSDNHSNTATPFEDAIVEQIKRTGHLTVTLHVALADHRESRIPEILGDGNDPTANMYWGALFGVETHFANAGGWRRAYTDDGNNNRGHDNGDNSNDGDNDNEGSTILRRVVFHRRVEPSPQWIDRGITTVFDVFVLANAWPSHATAAAMEQPLRDALCAEPNTLVVEGKRLEFGPCSIMSGYIGRNKMLDPYWNPFENLPPHPTAPRHQLGIFYICPQSAVVLHPDIIEHGLFPILFTKSIIVPEAYIADGVLNALIAGDLGEGFLDCAAEAYAKHQPSVSPAQARSMFYR